MTRRALPLLLLLPLLAAGACQRGGGTVSWGWERMINQRSLRAYEPSDLFADSMGMRIPPDGTVPRNAPIGARAVLTGRVGRDTTVAASRDTAAPRQPGRREAAAVQKIPIPLTITDLERGRNRFDIYCAPCHGVDGRAQTPVASNMPLKKPADLLSDMVRTAPDGHIFSVMTEGWGFMPSYAADLKVHDRWAVVAYVRALELAQGAPLDSLPQGIRDEFHAAVPAARGGAARDSAGGSP